MKGCWTVFVGLLASSCASLLACSSGGTAAAPAEAGTDAASSGDAAGSDAASPEPDGGGTEAAASDAADAAMSADADAGSEAQAPPRLLLSYNGTTQSELVAFGLQSKAADGVIVYPGFIGTTYVTPAAPWLLEQGNDVVAKLDSTQPWKVQSSWDVALGDYAPDAGFAAPYSDPDAIVVGAGTKAYVLRYTRNLVAVIDPSQTADGGAPTSTIDLSSQVQAGGDGYVEMTAGWYDAAHQRVYVLLADIDRFDVASNGYTMLCAPTSPTVVAIDTTTDTLVDLNGDAGVGFALKGYDPAFGPSPMVYDAPNDRLLVLESGCNEATADGGIGPVTRRGIESVSLATGATQMLVDLDAAPFPTALYYVDAQHVIVQLDTAYTWDPSSSTLGPAIPNAPAAFDVDGQGHLVGVTQEIEADGGAGPWQVVSVNPADGGVTTLGTNPFPAGDAGVGSGFVGGAQLWPPR